MVGGDGVGRRCGGIRWIVKWFLMQKWRYHHLASCFSLSNSPRAFLFLQLRWIMRTAAKNFISSANALFCAFLPIQLYNATWIGDKDLVLLGAFIGLFHFLSFLGLSLHVATLVLFNFLHAEEAQLALLDFVFDLVELLLQSKSLLHASCQQFVLLGEIILYSATQFLEEVYSDCLIVLQSDIFVGQMSNGVDWYLSSAFLDQISHLLSLFGLRLFQLACQGINFILICFIFIIIPGGVQLLIDVFEFGLHVDDASLQVQRVRYGDVSQNLTSQTKKTNYYRETVPSLFSSRTSQTLSIIYFDRPNYDSFQ